MSRHHLTERIWLRLKHSSKFLASLGTSDTLGTLCERLFDIYEVP